MIAGMPADDLVPYPLASESVLLPGLEDYRLADSSRLLTPALLVYPDVVQHNIERVIGLLGGDANRWRAHIKSAKLASVVRQLSAAGVSHMKCATTLELKVACEEAVPDVLLAYPIVGPKVERVRQLAREHPRTAISALVESASAVAAWRGAAVGLFVDVNPGMDRTGISDAAATAIVEVARAIQEAGLRFAGLHYYDGHISSRSGESPERTAHRGYDRLLALVAGLRGAGITVPEIITAGTPGLRYTISYPGFRAPDIVHRASPGTVVYNDVNTTAELPRAWDLRPAALVATTVVSHPASGRVTCDAGHKTVSADAGVPTCVVLGHPELEALGPSEEHLPLAVAAGARVPAIGEVLYLVPRHVCPTVNNFDEAALVRSHRIAGVERVAARGREAPLLA
jgi:D-serine deaminase-like pyridoxal phosphate-dependent protein